MEKQSIEEIGNKLEELAACVCKIAEGMAAIEESLYHVSERADKDMAKASGAALYLLDGLLENIAGQILDISSELKSREV